MKKLFTCLSVAGLIAAGSLFSDCSKNANGRNTLNLVDDATVLSLSSQQYSSFMAANPPINGTPASDMVKRVGLKVTTALQQYLAARGQSDLIQNYQWEFNLVNSAEVNAWCLPGGKIVVYTGILPLMQSDTDLAVVMGHEIAHAVLKHGSERMSQQLLLEYGGTALSLLLSSKPQQTQELFNAAFGITGTLSVLAFSRNQETEADESGLYYMASASYNPTVAIAFWQRMQAQSGGSSTPVFLRTHPTEADRIQHIKDVLPSAMAYYHP